MSNLETLTEETRNNLKSLEEIPEVTFSEEVIKKIKPIFESYWKGSCKFYNRTFIIETSQGHYAIMPNQYFFIAKILFNLALVLRIAFDDFDEYFRNDKEIRTIINNMQDMIKKDNKVLVKEHLLQQSQKIAIIFSSLPTERVENLCFLLGNLKDSKKFGNTEKDTFRTSADLFGSYLLNIAPLTTAESGSFGDLMYVLTSNPALYKELSEDLKEIKENHIKESHIDIPFSHNRIIFGAPGTGKSHQLDLDLKDKDGNDYFEYYERVTFHPSYSYANFVGTYKPVKDEKNNGQITYEFVEGPFIRVLRQALCNPEKNYLLIIEEINRANVTAVFGDVFQLLDRDSDNISQYEVAASEDLRKHLLKKGVQAEKAAVLRIPANMYVWASMNSADQGVQPLDTAFKRRWDFEYLNINEGERSDTFQDFEIIPSAESKMGWNKLRHLINNRLSSNYNINEDKLLGPFFIRKGIKSDEQLIKTFKSKVLMYLFEDVCKINPKPLFAGIGDEKLYFSNIVKSFDKIGFSIFNFSENEIQKAIEEIEEKQADE